MARWLFRWHALRRELWFRASLYALFGVAVALLAGAAAPLVPDAMAERLGTDSATSILTILASSLLAVATFSLGAMVTAYTATSTAASPRVASLVTSDPSSQKALSTFVGAFLYSMVALTAINANYYGPKGRSILFVASAVVVLIVALRLLAWIGRLSKLATISHMIEKVEALVHDSLRKRLKTPLRLPGEGTPVDGAVVPADRTGYVQHIALSALQSVAERLECRVEIVAAIGTFVVSGQTVLRTSLTACTDDQRQELIEAVSVADSRSYDHDPRFGLVVLGEIASKALSPGINDPGTAIDVIGSATRLHHEWQLDSLADDTEPQHDRLCAAALEPAELLDDVFTPIARDGAGDLAVSIALQHALAALRATAGPLADAADDLAASALRRSERAMDAPEDLARVQAARATRIRRVS